MVSEEKGKEWLTVDEAAKELSCEPNDVQTLIGGLPAAHHATRGYIIHIDDLNSFRAIINSINLKELIQRTAGPSDITLNKDKSKEVAHRPEGYIIGKAVGELLGISSKEVKLLIQRDILPGVTHGRGCYVDPKDVEEFKKTHNIGSIDGNGQGANSKHDKNINVKEVRKKPTGFLTGTKAAYLLNLFPNEVKKLVVEGELKGVTRGNGCYVDPNDIERFKRVRNVDRDSGGSIGASLNNANSEESKDQNLQDEKDSQASRAVINSNDDLMSEGNNGLNDANMSQGNEDASTESNSTALDEGNGSGEENPDGSEVTFRDNQPEEISAVNSAPEEVDIKKDSSADSDLGKDSSNENNQAEKNDEIIPQDKPPIFNTYDWRPTIVAGNGCQPVTEKKDGGKSEDPENVNPEFQEAVPSLFATLPLIGPGGEHMLLEGKIQSTAELTDNILKSLTKENEENSLSVPQEEPLIKKNGNGVSLGQTIDIPHVPKDENISPGDSFKNQDVGIIIPTPINTAIVSLGDEAAPGLTKTISINVRKGSSPDKKVCKIEDVAAACHFSIGNRRQWLKKFETVVLPIGGYGNAQTDTFITFSSFEEFMKTRNTLVNKIEISEISGILH
ncbi:MAG: hypothetical protein WC470_03480 [Candidatus Paceibacterota bacterium]